MHTTLAYESFGARRWGQSPLAAPPPPAAQEKPDPLNILPVADSVSKRWVFALLALVVAGLFFYAQQIIHVNAHGGTDQNGYLVGGKQFAQHLTTAYTPPDQDSFVGLMWFGADMGTPHERYYPKYPLGLPVLYAACLWIGRDQWPFLAYWVSPICMTLAILGMYRLMRPLLGAYGAILSMIALATSPVTILLGANPNSHAASLLFVIWGMVFLFAWWQKGGPGRALLAGLFLGYAVTIRYTEALLLLPVLLVILFNHQWKRPGSYGQVLALLIGWALPVGLLLGFNRWAFGAWTGYGPTHESTGFSWENFQDNWDNMLRQLTTTGLFFLAPIGVLGLLMMFRWNWRIATVLLAWLAPPAVLYTAYYWAPDGLGLGYARFFLTVLPPLTIGAVWLALPKVRPADGVPPVGRRLFSPLPAAIVVLLCAATSAAGAGPQLENDHRNNLTIAQAAGIVTRHAPAGSMIFSEDRLLNDLQFVADYQLYVPDLFQNRAFTRRWNNRDPNTASPLQSQRVERVIERTRNSKDADLIAEQNHLMTAALAKGQRVFFVLPRTSWERSGKRLITREFQAHTVIQWDDPMETPRERRPNRPRPNPRRGGTWEMVEITPKPLPPTSAPASRPTKK